MQTKLCRFLEKKNYPKIKRICWNLLTLIELYSRTITVKLHSAFGIMLLTLRFISSIACLLLFLQINLYLIVCFNGLLIIIFCVLLDVSVFFFCVPIIIINWIFGLLHVCFLATVPLILVIDVLTLNLIACISLVMFIFMNMFFRLIILNRLDRSRRKTTHHPLLPSSLIWPTPYCSPIITHPIPPLPLPYIHLLPKHHSLHLSFADHHMHLYLTIFLQVQVFFLFFLKLMFSYFIFFFFFFLWFDFIGLALYSFFFNITLYYFLNNLSNYKYF